MRRALIILLSVAVTLLPACSRILEVRAPIRFEVDRRLKLIEPDDEERVSVPVTIRWTAGDFEATDGRRFAVFLDRPPIGLDKPLRLRTCTLREEQPVVAGEARQPCRDDRESIFLTTETELTLDCIDPTSGPDRVKHRHTVSIIFIDEDWRRIGPAVATRAFVVREDKALRECRGLL